MPRNIRQLDFGLKFRAQRVDIIPQKGTAGTIPHLASISENPFPNFIYHYHLPTGQAGQRGGKKVFIPKEKVSIPKEKVCIPIKKVSIPIKKVSIPIEKVSIPIEKVSIPKEKVFIPIKKVSIPIEKVCIPMGKVCILNGLSFL